MLVEIHMIQNHSPSNLNRDDTGSPKECMFGGHKRARISSQCLKRSIRRSEIFGRDMEEHLASRTRRLPELVRERLLAGGVDAALAELAAKKASGFGTAEGTERKAQPDGTYQTAQMMFLTEGDIKAVTGVMMEAIEEAGSKDKFEKVAAKDLQVAAKGEGYRPITVDIALFGRMITSGAFRDVEASAQVAHALSTHKLDHEFDYFTAVDDLQGTSDEDDTGAGMISDVEFNSACYYKYFSIDIDGFISNLTGESANRESVNADEKKQASELAAKAVDSLLRAAVMTTPTGKQNTFAAHQPPAAILVEARPYPTPVNYANAFVDPARAGRDGDLVRQSLDKLSKHVEALTSGFNLESTARMMLAPEHQDWKIEGVERVSDLKSLCSRLRGVILDG